MYGACVFLLITGKHPGSALTLEGYQAETWEKKEGEQGHIY